VIVQADNLTHRYDSRVALDHVGFSVEAGEIFGLLGPNGGGKSTLFRILSTIMTPSEGSARIAGYDLQEQPDQVRRRIGVVFQTQSLDRKLTVAENLRGQGHLHGMRGAELSRRMQTVIGRLSLDGRENDLVETLSGGLRRRVEIAKGLLHEPSILLMDEASTGLDPTARRELWQYISELRERDGVTILLTSHILDEADRCDRLLLLHQGRVVGLGSPAELKARIGGDVVVLESHNPESLAPRLASRFGVKANVVGNAVRVEIANGHRFIAEAVEAFPGEVESVALHKPTLEDVFVRETGATLE